MCNNGTSHTLVEAHRYVLNKQQSHFRAIYVQYVQYVAGHFDQKDLVNCRVQVKSLKANRKQGRKRGYPFPISPTVHDHVHCACMLIHIHLILAHISSSTFKMVEEKEGN